MNTVQLFMIINDIYISIVTFSTVTNLNTFWDTHNIYENGKFKSCPKFIHQMFTVYGFVDNEAYKQILFGIFGKKNLTLTFHYSNIQLIFQQ